MLEFLTGLCKQGSAIMSSRRGLKRLASLAVTASATISAVRVLVLFFESYSRVSAARSADAKLLQLCRAEESAAASAKFAEACLAARADGAAPILLKSLLAACNTVFTDAVELFSSPTRVAVIILLVLSGVSAPLFKFLLTTLVAGLRTRQEEEEEEEESQRTIVTVEPYYDEPTPWKRLQLGMKRRIEARLAPKLHDD